MSDHQLQCMTNYFAHAECDCRAGEIERLRAELAASREREARMRKLIADDSHAMTFQSLGQYRTALLRALAEGAQG